MTKAFTEKEKEEKRAEFLASQCRSGTFDLGNDLAQHGPAWWPELILEMGPRNSEGFTFHVNGKLVEVAAVNDTIHCELHGSIRRTLVYQRRTKPYNEGQTIDDSIFGQHPIAYISGWYRGEQYLQPGQVLREIIDAVTNKQRSAGRLI